MEQTANVPATGAMRAQAAPVIKGVFVNSHVQAVRRALGDAGVRALEEEFGAPVSFRATEDVPVRDEVRIIELALDLLRPGDVPPEDRAYEAGRLHFRNFTTTPWAKILFRIFPRNYHYMIMHARVVAERVFKGITIQSEELAPTKVQVQMENADYPIDHFRGLFHEWMRYFDLQGRVTAEQAAPGTYIYTMEWEEP